MSYQDHEPGRSAAADPQDLPLFTKRPSAFGLAGTIPPANPTIRPVEPRRAQQDVALGTVEPAPFQEAQPATPTPPATTLDWTAVSAIRDAVTNVIPEQNLTLREDDRAAVESLILEEIGRHNRRRVHVLGEEALSAAQREALFEGVRDAVWGAGRLQRLLDRTDLEDIMIRGCDVVWLHKADGTVERGEPVAETDEQLIRDLQTLAQTNPNGERRFGPADPRLDLALPGGHRLSASMEITHRPCVTIRFHRYTHIDLARLEQLGSIDPTLRQFLSASIRAGKSIVIAGLPAAGKTTNARAMLNELDPKTPIATIETEFELFLHEMPDRHQNVWAAQARKGGEDGAGEITLGDLIEASLRQSVDRIVVGEVRGKEILPMLAAMQAGKGSVSTIHAGNAEDAIRRMVACALEAGVPREFAISQVTGAIDLIIYADSIDERQIGGKKHRFISEVIAIEPSAEEGSGGVAVTHLFTPDETGRAVPTGILPPWEHQLRLVGYDTGWLTSRYSAWPPIDLITRRGGGGA